MIQYPPALAKLIESFMKLPGIGEKSAVRLAFYVLTMEDAEVAAFSRNLLEAKRHLHACPICGNLTEDKECSICKDQSRDQSTVLVVEQVVDVMSLEKMQEYHGLYHVLNGVLSPSAGTGVEDINLMSLLTRLKKHPDIQEVILGTNNTVEGEATARYISQLLKPIGIKVTRLACGLSAGSDIGLANEMTLFRALEGRREV